MGFCTSCGQRLLNGWQFCGSCGTPAAVADVDRASDAPSGALSPVVEEPPLQPSPEWAYDDPTIRNLITLGLLAAAGTAAAGLFPPYFTQQGNNLDAAGLSGNVPIMAAWFVSAGLSAFRRTFVAGVGIAITTTALALVGVLDNIISVVRGTFTGGPGFTLTVTSIAFGVVASTAGALAAFRWRRLHVRSGTSTALWFALVLVPMGVWVVGLVLPAYSLNLHLLSGVFRNGGNLFTTSCCSVFSGADTPTYVQYIILIVVAIALTVCLACLRPASAAAGMLLGISVGLASAFLLPLAVQIPRPYNSSNPPPSWTSAQAYAHGLNGSWKPTVGFWLVLGGLAGVLVMAVVRALSNTEPRSALVVREGSALGPLRLLATLGILALAGGCLLGLGATDLRTSGAQALAGLAMLAALFGAQLLSCVILGLRLSPQLAILVFFFGFIGALVVALWRDRAHTGDLAQAERTSGRDVRWANMEQFHKIPTT